MPPRRTVSVGSRATPPRYDPHPCPVARSHRKVSRWAAGISRFRGLEAISSEAISSAHNSSLALQVGEGTLTHSTWHMAALERMRAARPTSVVDVEEVQEANAGPELQQEGAEETSSDAPSDVPLWATAEQKAIEKVALVDASRMSAVAGSYPAYAKLAAPVAPQVAMEMDVEAEHELATEQPPMVPAARAAQILRDPALRSRWLSELCELPMAPPATPTAGVKSAGGPTVLVLQPGVSAADIFSTIELAATAADVTVDVVDGTVGKQHDPERQPAAVAPLKASVEGLHTRFLLEAFLGDAERELTMLQQGTSSGLMPRRKAI